MSELPHRLQALLDAQGVAYQAIEHRRDYAAEDTAADTHTPSSEFAKAVLVRTGAHYALAVLPAHHHVDTRALADALGEKDVELASEDEIARILPDCEPGAVPPLGPLWGLPVYVSPMLAHRERVTFNAGTHTTALRMSYADFQRLAAARVVDFSVFPLLEDA